MPITIGTADNYGSIPQGFNFEIPEGYTTFVGKNDTGKSTILQLIFKTMVRDISEIGPGRVCILLPERIFIDASLETRGETIDNYNQNLANAMASNPLAYHNLGHASEQIFKLLFSNYDQRAQWEHSDPLLRQLGFNPIAVGRGGHTPTIDRINLGNHGSGLRTVLSIIAAITDPNIEYLLIDEPEQSLEPGIQKFVRDMLYTAAESKKVIVTTHSHLFLNRRNIKSNYIVSKDEAGTRVAGIQSDVELYDLVYRLLGSSPEDLLFPKNFLVVEGSSDQAIVEKVISLMGHGSIDVKVISARSVSGVDSYRQAFEACLTPYVLRESHYKDKVVVLVDQPNAQIQPTVEMLRHNIGDRLFELPNESLEEFLPEDLYTRVGRDRDADIARIVASRGDYNALRVVKAEISEQIAAGLTETDLPRLQPITDSINKALEG